MNYLSEECPLIIGVTGHRDLLTENFNMINSRLDEIFNDIEHKFKDLPKVVFSPLAEGADRLVAKKAIERGYKLFVPMPMPVNDYEKDFAEVSAKNEFRELIGNAEKVFEIPVSYELEKENDLSIQSNKNLRYAVVGRFMASNCDILISVTDGIKQNIPGGSSYVTTLMIEGISFIETSDKWIAPEYGLVYHLITPRKKNEGKTSGTPFSWTIIPSRSVLDETEAGKAKVISGIKMIHRHLRNYSRDCFKNCDRQTDGCLSVEKWQFGVR